MSRRVFPVRRSAQEASYWIFGLHAVRSARWFEAVAACIRTYGVNRDRMRCDPCRKRGLPVGSGVVKAPASASSGTDSNSRDAVG